MLVGRFFAHNMRGVHAIPTFAIRKHTADMCNILKQKKPFVPGESNLKPKQLVVYIIIILQRKPLKANTIKCSTQYNALQNGLGQQQHTED